MELEIPGSPFSPVILRLSVGANGTHIYAVVSKPGYVVSSTRTKVEQKGTITDSVEIGSLQSSRKLLGVAITPLQRVCRQVTARPAAGATSEKWSA